MACLPCLTPYIIPAIAGTTIGISSINSKSKKSKKRNKNQKAGKYTKKYIKNLTDKQIRELNDKELLKYKKIFKIIDRKNKPYTPKQVASIIIKKRKSKTKKK